MKLRKRIRELIDILDAEGIDEIEVRTLWSAVRVARRRSHHAHARTETSPAAEPEENPTETAGADLDLEKIVSPMVGTFYRSPNPETEPFVFEGKRVERGEVICIIEAMKLMNEIEAEKSGIIRKILVQDAEPVEYGQPLFLVESA